MKPVRFCICIERHFEDTFENPLWRKAKQMQPMWLCVHWGWQFQHPFENAQRKHQTNAMSVTLHSPRQAIWGFMLSWILRLPVGANAKSHSLHFFDFSLHCTEIWNKCNLCNYSSSQPANLMNHLKMHIFHPSDLGVQTEGLRSSSQNGRKHHPVHTLWPTLNLKYQIVIVISQIN